MTLNTDGSFRYTPNAGFCGSDSFTYDATDGEATSTPATVTITVYSVPVAVNDAYGVIAGQILAPDVANGVLANDSTADGNPLTAQLQTGTSNGYLILNNDGSFLYLPNTGYFGPDSFTYTASDGAATSTPATVNITVYSCPVALNESYAVFAGQTLTTAAANGVLAFDSNAYGNQLTAQLVTGPLNGQLTLNADGSFSYTPNAGFCGSDSFIYTATDGSATSSPATVTLNVYSVPLAVNVTYADITGETLAPNAANGVLAYDSNADGNPLTAQLVTGPIYGQLTLNADGSFSYTPNSGFCGTDSFTYAATDGEATSTPATVAINVYSVPVAVNDTYGVIAGQALEPDADNGVLANDTNADGNTLTALLQTGTSNGSLTLNTDGSFLYVPNMGYAGPDSFTYTASDGDEISMPATVNINVYSGTVSMNETYAVIAGQTLTTTAATGVLAFDSNAVGNPLTAQLVTGPVNGQMTLNADGSFSYTPNSGFCGTDSFTYSATYDEATSTPATVTITVYSVPAICECRIRGHRWADPGARCRQWRARQ